MMRTRLISRWAALGIGLGAAALLAAGPAAAQQPMPGGDHLSLSPSTVAPGGTVSISMGCRQEPGTFGVRSPITGVTHLQKAAAGPASHNFSGSVTIPRNTRHGTYQFTGSCGSASLVVGPGGTGPRGGTGLDADNGVLIAAGTGTLAAATAGGFWLLRRREADAPVA